MWFSINIITKIKYFLNINKELEFVRVYILDDHYFFCELLKKVLQKNGIKKIKVFTDEHNFLKSISGNPDIVFIDHNLKYSIGETLIKYLSLNSPETKVIYMSSSTRNLIKVAKKRNGIYFMSKNNLNPENIFDMVHKVLMTPRPNPMF